MKKEQKKKLGKERIQKLEGVKTKTVECERAEAEAATEVRLQCMCNFPTARCNTPVEISIGPRLVSSLKEVK